MVWARQLVLVFGNTTQAISAILTGFFGGMAIGSFVGGRLADRVRRPLRMYGLLEIALVVVVLADARSRSACSTSSIAASSARSRRSPPARPPPVRAGAPRPRSGHGDDGRDAADPDPLPEPGRRPPVAGLRAAVCGEHDRGDHRDHRRRLRPDRAASGSPARSRSAATCSAVGRARRTAPWTGGPPPRRRSEASPPGDAPAPVARTRTARAVGSGGPSPLRRSDSDSSSRSCPGSPRSATRPCGRGCWRRGPATRRYVFTPDPHLLPGRDRGRGHRLRAVPGAGSASRSACSRSCSC